MKDYLKRIGIIVRIAILLKALNWCIGLCPEILQSFLALPIEMRYLPKAEPMISNFTSTQVGVLLDGYVTFAMRPGGGTGFFGGDAAPEKWKSSGMVKRAPAGKANFKHKLILNKDSRFRDKGMYNEFIVDNWKPTALIAKGGINNPFYKEIYNYSVENNLPVIDENGDQVELQDPAEFSAGKKISTGFGRLARGALPEGEKMKITTARLKEIIKEEIEAALAEDEELEEEKDWIQKAVDPEHEGYCTPMTKKTCTPARKALAKRFKKAAKKKEKKGGTGWQGKV